MTYSNRLPADTQIDMEEKISSLIFDNAQGDEDGIGEDQCADLGRKILRMVLEEFRPDLMEEDHA